MFSPHPLRNPRPRHDRKKRACLKAARTAAEKLESRVLLDSVLETAILHALPPQERGNFAPNGALVLSYARQPHAMAPTYSLLDAQPSLDAQGKLSPFATTGPTGILPAALRHAYGIDQIKFGSVVGNGAGQTIAIIDAYDYPTALSDLQAFDRALGLPDPPSFKKVNQSGGSTLPGVDPAGAGHDWETEEALDIQWAHAIAPAANIILVECNSAYNSDLLDAGVNWARSAPGVSAVSMSFGAPEWATETSEDGLFTTPAGHRGVTFLAASGDKGGFADYPAYSPNVVAVGGTSLTVDGSGNYQSEMAWFGSGGGISAYESQPAFQKGVVTQSTSRRTIPDVAFDADPNTGVPVYDSYDFGAATPWAQFGGTSLSAPCWAGLIAIANQNRALGGATSLNGATTILPRLYASAAGNFHDITTGGGFGGYAAAAGYDLITGLGTPLANLLVPHLSAYGPYVTGVSPVGLQSAAPTSIGFNFNMPINPATFSIASDVVSFTGPGGQNLLSQIKGFTWLNNNSTLQVNFAAPSAEGPYRMTIGPNILSASGAPMDQNQNGLNAEGAFDQFTGIVQYDKNPLTVASTTPAAGSTIAAPFTTITLHFNRPYDRNTAGVNNLSLSQGAVSAYSCIGAQTISYTLSGITLAGAIVVSMPFGALNDTCGNPMLAFSAQYNIPVPPAPGMPALLAASDTGVSSSDGITNLDNSTAAKALRFSVANTMAGNLVSLYADGVCIGSATATGSTTTITTGGNASLSAGMHAITARQGPQGGLGNASAARSITILTSAPFLASKGGVFDSSFNGTGFVITHLPGANEFDYLAVQRDGKTVACGQLTAPGNFYTSIAVARYNVDGSLDTSFGVGGIVVTPISSNGQDDYGRSVAIQADGKIVVAGENTLGGSPLIVLRYNRDGTLDPTFGAGGQVVTKPAGNWFNAWSLALQPDGKIVVGGSSFYGPAIARLTSRGAFDTTFNGTGYNFGGIPGRIEGRIYSLAIAPDGHIYGGGLSLPSTPGGSIIAIERYTASGVLDTSYNQTGYVLTSFGSAACDAWSIALQPDGKLLADCNIARNDGPPALLLRYRTDGSLDTTFGSSGMVTIQGVGPMALQPDGKILAGAGSLQRFLPSGQVDTTFGTAGSVSLSIGPGSSYFNSLVVLPNGRIEGAGYYSADLADPSAGDFALIRLSGGPEQARLDPLSDSGISNSDNITRATTPTFDACTLPGYYARIYRNGVLASSSYPAGGSVALLPQPAGTWNYTQTLVDAAGNESAPSAATKVTIDPTPPIVGNLVAAPIPASAVTVNFTVTYTDNTAVNLKSLGGGNILVTGPNNFSQYAKFISASPASNSPTIIATYQISRPAAGWATGNVWYTPTLKSGQVCDIAGNFAGSIAIGAIGVVANGSPNKPQLLGTSDSGVSASDAITNCNNGSSARALCFLVTGCLSGAKVTIYADGIAIGSATSTGATTTVMTNGTSTLKDGMHQITVRQTPTNGTQSGDSLALAITIDTGAPAASLSKYLIPAEATPALLTVSYSDATGISVASLGSQDLLVSGPNGYRQFATFLSASPNINAGTIAATYQAPAPTGGWGASGTLYSISLCVSQVFDIAGNAAAAKTLGSMSATKVAAPGQPALAAATDSGSSSTDRITNFNNSSKSKALKFTVASTVAGATVTVYADGIAIGSATATGTTTTIVTDGATVLADGMHSITARQVIAGNQSASSPTVSITIDTIAPAIPAPVLDPASDSGSSNKDGITNVSAPTIDVYAPEAGTLYLACDGKTAVPLVVAKPGTYAIAATAPAGFSAPVTYAVNGIIHARAGDANGDGKLDLITADSDSSFSVRLGNGDGTFQKPTIVFPAYRVVDVGAADFFGNGTRSIEGAGDAALSFFYISNGSYTSISIPYLSPFGIATCTAVTDLNGDGRPDVVVAGQISGSRGLDAFINTGNKTFAQHLISGVSGFVNDMLAADFNGDGKIDLAVPGTTGLQVFPGRGDGTFNAPLTVCKGIIDQASSGDFNGDGKIDLAAEIGGQSISIFLGNGDGTFHAGAVMPVTMASGVAAGDFNGDGKLDIAAAINGTPPTFMLRYGNGDGTFQAPVSYPGAGPNATLLGAADFNGDRRPDLFASLDCIDLILSKGGPLSAGVHSVTAWETDVAGNKSATSAATKFTIDLTAPTGKLSAPALAQTAANYSFTITWSDNVAVNRASLGNSNILITAPGGYSQLATLVSATPASNAASIVATYRITRPTAGWGAAGNAYSIKLQSAQVGDVAGNKASSATLGTFTVASPTLIRPSIRPLAKRLDWKLQV